jgi:hypothetical protein
MRALLLVAAIAACSKSARPRPPDVTGTLTVGSVPTRLVACRPGHAVHVFVEVETTAGTLRFGDGKLYWLGTELSCPRLERSWGGGVRSDGSAYFRGTLAFTCPTAGGPLSGELTLDCGQITPDERAELDRNRATARGPAGPR